MPKPGQNMTSLMEVTVIHNNFHIKQFKLNQPKNDTVVVSWFAGCQKSVNVSKSSMMEFKS